MKRTNILIIILIIVLIAGIYIWYQNTKEAKNKAELEKEYRNFCFGACVYDENTKNWSYTIVPTNPDYRVFPTQESCANYCMSLPWPGENK